MAKVLSAKDYGFRKVLQVCLNPDEPEWVHVVGEVQRDRQGNRVMVLGVEQRITNGADPPDTRFAAPANHTGDSPAGPGKVSCHNCHANWKVRQFVWEGERLFIEEANGKRPKTPQELLGEVREAIAATPSTENIRELEKLVL